MATRELWKSIPGHKGYKASNLGRIKSVNRTLKNGHRKKGKILKQTPNPNGYLQVSLGKHTKFNVHTLILLTFKGKRRSKKETYHRDSNRSNNRLTNLRYGSRSENALERERRRRAQDPWFE